MKKNKMMRLASTMMVLTLMTTSVISGTFAKYVTKDSATDGARVAKWGVSVVATDASMFSDTYLTDSKKTVEAGGVVKDKLVAPGTSLDTPIDLFTITGTPEVAVKLDIVIEDTTKKDVFLSKENIYADMITTGIADDTFNFTSEATNYYPVVFELKNDGSTVATGNLQAIETYLESLTSNYIAPGTDLSDVYGTYTLAWAWEFPTTESVAIDQKDTLLGDLAADKNILAKKDGEDFVKLVEFTDYCTELFFEISVTVTQVD